MAVVIAQLQKILASLCPRLSIYGVYYPIHGGGKCVERVRDI